MPRKTFIFFIIFLGLMAILAIWYLFFRPSTTGVITGPSTTQNLFPFGQGPVGTTTRPVSQGGGTISTTTVIDLSGLTPQGELPRLRELWKEPVAGAAFVLSPIPSATTTPATSTPAKVSVKSATSTAPAVQTFTSLSVRFVERSTGHIHDSLLDQVADTKISNVTIPQISQALIAPNGREMILRYLKDSTIQSFYARLASTTALSDIASTSAIEGYFLPQNIRDMSLLGSTILYFDPSSTNGNLIESNIDGTKRVSVMNSDLRDWSLSWTSPNTAFLSTRPSGAVDGFGYIFDITKGTLTKVIDAARGLYGTLNPAGDYIFVSGQDNNGVVSASYNVKTGELKLLSLGTLADKCAWSNVDHTIIYCAVPVSVPSGTYPDDWYQGVASFTDRLWRIHVDTGETDLLLDPSFEALRDMDIINLSVDPGDAHILFTNKKDMSLWLYRMSATI